MADRLAVAEVECDPRGRTTRDFEAEPACWGWPLPAIRSRSADLAELIRVAVGLAYDVGDEDVVRRRLLRMDDEAVRFLEFHGGRCAICGFSDSDLVVDHDHWSGLVRGFLCSGCNGIEGAWRADLLPLFTRYRRRHPAAIAGYFETYKAAGAHQIALSFSRRVRRHRLRRVATGEALTRTVSKISEHLLTSTLACTPEHLHESRMLRCMTRIVRTCTEHADADDGVIVEPPEEVYPSLADLMTVLDDAAERALSQHSVKAVEDEGMSVAAQAASWVPPWERPGYVSRREADLEIAEGRHDRGVDAESTVGHIDQIRDLRDLAQSGRRLCWRMS